MNDYGIGKIRAFASTVPSLCPDCYSPYYYKKYSQCDNGHKFSKNKIVSNWDIIIKNNQEAFKSSELNILVTTKAFGMGIDKGSTRFTVHTTMAGSIESWYQEIGRAGRDGEASHCVQIVDVPVDACYKDYLSSTNPPHCSFKRGCIYPNKELCDYGKQHIFIEDSYPSIDNDAMLVLVTLNKLLGYKNQENIVISSPSKDEDKDKTELALHRLQTIGIIDKFFITYKYNSVDFEINNFYFPINEKNIFNKTISYLQKNDISQNGNKYTEEKISNLKENSEYRQPLMDKLHRNLPTYYDKYKEFFDMVSGYLLVILHHVYDDVKKMRYNLLQDLLFEIINTKNCQRVAVLRYFSPNMAIDENYRCGFCSNCVPDLNFEVKKAKSLEFSKDSEDILRRLDDILAINHIFNWDELFNIVEDLKAYPQDAHSRARRTLGYSPRNLSALFIAKEFSEQNTLKRDCLYFIEIASEDFDLENAIKAYETVLGDYKIDVFQLLTKETSVFNCPEGETWLYSESKKLHKKYKLPKRIVEGLALNLINTELEKINFSQHKVKLKQLRRDL